jgi:hypothetical protein
MAYTVEQIAQACNAPIANVRTSWPLLLAALDWQHCNDHATRVACAATVCVETGVTVNGVNETFLPISELGGPEAWYAPYYGRGYIQLTLRENYAAYGAMLNLDLVGNPDLALQPDVAAKVLALYFVNRGIPAIAAAGNWTGVREAVNGGLFGWNTFWTAVKALEAIPEPPDPPADPFAVAGTMLGIVTKSALKTEPSHESAVAIGPDHKPVAALVPGTSVITTGHETPHWVEVHLTPPLQMVHGYVLKTAVRV